MNELTTLNPNHSTTRLVRKVDAGIVEAEIKAAHKPEDKFETMLFLPEGEGRKGEGGLRTQGYFKQSQEDKPLITVVTVVFNGEKFLEETILSVINQTYDNVEYIIIDGGSTDGTLDIIRKYEHAIDYWVSEKDDGIYDAWNKAVMLSFGKWLAFLGSDDFYEKNALELYSEKLEDSYDYISSLIVKLDESEPSRVIYGNSWSWKVYQRIMNVAHVGSLHNCSLFKEVGLYDIHYKIAGDYELLLRKRSKLKSFFVSKVTATMRMGGISHIQIFRSFAEIRYAKIYTGGRSAFLSWIEYGLMLMKIRIKYFFVTRAHD